MNSRLCMRASNIRLMMMMMMMMTSGWISLAFFIDNYTTNHLSNFRFLLPSFSAGYAKFRLTNCFQNGRKNNRYTLMKKTDYFVLLLPKVKMDIKSCTLSLNDICSLWPKVCGHPCIGALFNGLGWAPYLQ